MMRMWGSLEVWMKKGGEREKCSREREGDHAYNGRQAYISQLFHFSHLLVNHLHHYFKYIYIKKTVGNGSTPVCKHRLFVDMKNEITNQGGTSLAPCLPPHHTPSYRRTFPFRLVDFLE
mmetsp:Transcript_3244/g.6298  ORF Transcript_3244/g.6298 Transcript_3244/m.6298 type:complete len:119 (+) Transcript_3244:2307-2663(+)